jgi:hypothetical protein
MHVTNKAHSLTNTQDKRRWRINTSMYPPGTYMNVVQYFKSQINIIYPLVLTVMDTHNW